MEPKQPPTGAPSDPQAAAARAKHTDKHINFAAATGAVALSVLAARAPKLAAKVILPVTGIDLSKAGKAKVTPLAALWLLPQPFGIVPSGWYGLPPNYLARVAPFLPESAYLHTVAPNHPSVIAHNQMLERSRALTAGKLDRGGRIMAESAEVVKGFDLGAKVVAIKTARDDLNAWFHRQLTGPHHEALGGGLTSPDLIGPTADVINPPGAGDYGADAPPVPPPSAKLLALAKLAAQVAVGTLQALQATAPADP